MNKIIRSIFGAATVFYCTAAISAPYATTFSFAGIQWGESVDQVEARLRSSGLTFESSWEKIACKFRDACSLRFDGTLSGSAAFDKHGAVEVVIFSSNGTSSERLAKLIKQYGPPLKNPPTVPGPGYLTRMDSGSHWLSASGESLDFDGGYIRYASAPANQQRAARNPDVKF